MNECRLPVKQPTCLPGALPSQATCERGFAAMEETHQKVIEDLQRQHQREVSKLLEERERLLAEETAATIAGMSSHVIRVEGTGPGLPPPAYGKLHTSRGTATLSQQVQS